MEEKTPKRCRLLGFSLVELLICLAILGILACLTMPSLLNTAASSKNSQQTAAAKDTFLMVLNAFEQHKAQHGDTVSSMEAKDLTPYFNYVSVVTGGQLVDDMEGSGSVTCDGSSINCYALHNGGILYFYVQGSVSDGFCDNGSNPSGFPMKFDPDGVYGGSTTGPSKALPVHLYNTGKILSRGNIPANTGYSVFGTTTCNAFRNPDASLEPTWFAGF
jgi:prepilin-type N-terminal cleavage/methylation domain-containing protein